MFWRKIPQVIIDSNRIDGLLGRSVAEVLPSRDAFKKMLLSGKRLRIYVGADATGPQLHLGHSTNFLFLERLRRLGHEVIVLFGDFTAMIGDPSDKEAVRKTQTQDEVNTHIASWKSQVEKILPFDGENPAVIQKNSAWLASLSLEDILPLASSFTVQQMLERSMFQQRLANERPIYLHEFLYPLMQGYDSVAMNVDAEVGGTDQTFNMLAGRVLQKRLNDKEKFVITTTLLENPTTGKKLMSKSDGGYIAMNDSPKDMYAKTMALPDSVITQMFIDCTNKPLAEIEAMRDDIKNNPYRSKTFLAEEIVALYYGKSAAQAAALQFQETFKEKKIPTDMLVIHGESGVLLVDLLLRNEIVSSRSDFRRLVEAGAVNLLEQGDVKIINVNALACTGTYRIGKHRFVKVVIR